MPKSKKLESTIQVLEGVQAVVMTASALVYLRRMAPSILAKVPFLKK